MWRWCPSSRYPSLVRCIKKLKRPNAAYSSGNPVKANFQFFNFWSKYPEISRISYPNCPIIRVGKVPPCITATGNTVSGTQLGYQAVRMPGAWGASLTWNCMYSGSPSSAREAASHGSEIVCMRSFGVRALLVFETTKIAQDLHNHHAHRERMHACFNRKTTNRPQ